MKDSSKTNDLKCLTQSKSQTWISSVSKAVSKQQPKSSLDKVYGIIPSVYGGINPIINTSYPSDKKPNSRKRK